ncbi:hypothetical protein F6X37_25995 [Paraburkholderia sp. 31.1]|nr:hypothetical protein [Paraburkholderia sp. 31.1]
MPAPRRSRMTLDYRADLSRREARGHCIDTLEIEIDGWCSKSLHPKSQSQNKDATQLALLIISREENALPHNVTVRQMDGMSPSG